MSRSSQTLIRGRVFFALLVVLCAGDWPVMNAAAVGQEEVPRYLGPSSVVVAPNGKTLYVACEDACQVLAVDLPSGNVRARITVPGPPTGLLYPDGIDKLIVTCGGRAGSC